MAKLPHLIDTTGTGKIVIVLEEATYQNIGDVVGVTKLTGTPPTVNGSLQATALI